MDIREVRPDELERVIDILIPDTVTMAGASVPRGLFVDRLREMGYDLDNVIVAERDGKLVGAMFYSPAPDDTVLVARPRLIDGLEDEELEVRMVRWMHDRATEDERFFLQSLSTPDDRMTRRVFTRAGFRHGASFLHMRREADPVPERFAPLADTVQVLTYTDDRHPEFVQALEATYRGSMDCPDIPRHDNLELVLETHKLSGTFRPRTWWLARDNTGDIGVVLLNEEPTRSCMDLVYMGVVPDRRGRGWGANLLAEALRRLNESDLPGAMELAVDEANRPAIDLYHALGFHVMGRSIALIDPLDDPA